jgi:hypothetical protein
VCRWCSVCMPTPNAGTVCGGGPSLLFGLFSGSSARSPLQHHENRSANLLACYQCMFCRPVSLSERGKDIKTFRLTEHQSMRDLTRTVFSVPKIWPVGTKAIPKPFVALFQRSQPPPLPAALPSRRQLTQAAVFICATAIGFRAGEGIAYYRFLPG